MNQLHLSSTRQPATHQSTDLPSPGQRIIVIDAILDIIFSFSSPRTIVNLSKTWRAARPIVASYFRAAYKPERLLQRFLPDPAVVQTFRALQAETGLTIFGNAAYDFLSRASFSATDTLTAVMSLYVDKSYAFNVNDFFTGAGYDVVEMREHELVFLRTGKDDHIINKVVLQASLPDSFDSVDKPRNLPIGTCGAPRCHNKRLMRTIPFLFFTELTDVITFDGAYSPFGQQTSVVPPPQLPFGTSLPVRDPLYTSSLLVSPPKGRPTKRHRDSRLCGVVLRSRLLRLTHILCCAELSQFVQQFLTRLVIAHPGRSNSQCVPDFVSPLSRAIGLTEGLRMCVTRFYAALIPR